MCYLCICYTLKNALSYFANEWEKKHRSLCKNMKQQPNQASILVQPCKNSVTQPCLANQRQSALSGTMWPGTPKPYWVAVSK